MDLRNTPGKLKIIEVFEKSEKPLTAKEIIKKVNLNKTTVYRKIEKLLVSNLISEIDFGDGIKRYETTKDHHHHLVCKNCGEIEDIKINEQILLKKIKSQSGFKIEKHLMEFFGKCQNCI